MLLRLKLLGTGVPNDPYRVNLPTYSLVHGNIDHGFAIVNVPDDVHGFTADDLASESVEHTTEGDFYPALSSGTLAKLHANLDERYREHKGKFRVEVA